MSDNLRKGLGEQASEKIQPDSTKSTTQKAGETATGLGDKVAGAVQPNQEKSATQSLGDSTRSGADKGQSEGKGVLGSVTDTASGAANSASETISNAADSLTGNSKST